MSTTSFVRIIEEDGRVSVVLDRPPLNIMNIDMMRELNAALEHLLNHKSARALIVRAAGKAFSAGVDIADHTGDRVAVMMKDFHRMFELINCFTIPVIAAVDGAALGGGCELAVFCDMILASDRAKFGQPEIRVGVFPPVAAVIFPRLIGRNRTLEWLMNGGTLTASEAERIGLVNRVYPAEAFDAGLKAFVEGITSQSRAIIGMTKRAVDDSLRQPVMQALAGAERLYLDEMMKTEDAQEGLNAFMEKRQPVWKNR